jgi:hypothetical protein
MDSATCEVHTPLWIPCISIEQPTAGGCCHDSQVLMYDGVLLSQRSKGHSLHADHHSGYM